MRVSKKELQETFDVFRKDLTDKYGEVNLWITDAGLPNAIYKVSNGKDLVRGNNGILWKWIIEHSKVYETFICTPID